MVKGGNENEIFLHIKRKETESLDQDKVSEP